MILSLSFSLVKYFYHSINFYDIDSDYPVEFFESFLATDFTSVDILNLIRTLNLIADLINGIIFPIFNLIIDTLLLKS